MTKGIVSDISRGTNAALHAIGLDSGKLDLFGHPFLHPLSECYYSQSPFHFGEYVAKFNVVLTAPGLTALAGEKLEPKDENGLRTDVCEFFRSHDAEYEFGVQLATDLEKMPIEDASVEWPEDLSPYQAVARIVIPAQDAYSAEKAQHVEGLSFSPAHTLPEHRGLGSINRARVAAYNALASKRQMELITHSAVPTRAI